jgi:hypothetical protein
VDNDLSEQYNEGVVPPPELSGEPTRLIRPAWQPTRQQLIEANPKARRLAAGIGLLFFLLFLIIQSVMGRGS